MQPSPGRQEASAVAHGSDEQSLDEGSGDREKEEEMFQKCTQWAGCQVIRGEAKAGHVRNAAKAMYVTSHHLLTTKQLRETWGTPAVKDDGTAPPFPYLGSRVWYAVCNIPDKASNISILYQSSNPFRNVIQKPHGIA